MKAFVKNFAGTAIVLASFCTDVLASPCGKPGLRACDLPEPTSPMLFLVAAAVAGAIYKLRK